MKIFGQRLRELRTEKNMSLEQLGKKIGVTRATVAHWETRDSEPKYETLVSLADALGTTPNYLLGVEKALTLEDVKAAFCKHYNTEFWETINKIWSVYVIPNCQYVDKT
jgi:transcriptional regulator with XRE-family HTH domain